LKKTVIQLTDVFPPTGSLGGTAKLKPNWAKIIANVTPHKNDRMIKISSSCTER